MRPHTTRVDRWWTALVALGLWALASTLAGAQTCDLSSEVTGPAMVAPAAVGTYTVAYGNAGPDEATSAYCNLDLPSGVPARFDLITQGMIDFIAASAWDSAGNQPLVFANTQCDAILIQNQGPGSTPPVPMQGMTAGASNQFSISTEFPMATSILSGGLRIDAPAAIAGRVTNIGRGSRSRTLFSPTR